MAKPGKPQVWVVAADAGRARIFTSNNRKKLIEHEVLVSPEAHLSERELVTDAPGRATARNDGRRQTYTPRVTRRDSERTRFAQEICEVIDAARRKGKVTRIYLVAEPAMLGEIRNNLDEVTGQAVAGTVPAGVTRMEPAEIRELLPLFL